MKTILFSTTAALALIFANTSDAQAGKFQLVIGGGGYNQGFYGGNVGFGGGHLHHGVDPHANPYPIGGHYHWHDTTHYDYIPGHWVRHGCH